jgi:hypothetical protein
MSQLLELEKLKLAPSTFCAPHYIEQLGCDGLTAEEIATSLGTRVSDVRRKLRDFPNETLKSLKYEISYLKNINGVEYADFMLSTAAAKFFVARYDNEIGDGYLEYLIRLDMAVEKRCKEFEKKTILLQTRLGELQEENYQLLNEPVTAEELTLLDRTANATLKRHGRLKLAYKRGFKNEIISKFWNPGEDPGTYSFLPRKNFKAAILYARNREFDWTTTKEFV